MKMLTQEQQQHLKSCRKAFLLTMGLLLPCLPAGYIYGLFSPEDTAALGIALRFGPRYGLLCMPILLLLLYGIGRRQIQQKEVSHEPFVLLFLLVLGAAFGLTALVWQDTRTYIYVLYHPLRLHWFSRILGLELAFALLLEASIRIKALPQQIAKHNSFLQPRIPIKRIDDPIKWKNKQQGCGLLLILAAVWMMIQCLYVWNNPTKDLIIILLLSRLILYFFGRYMPETEA